MNTETNYNFIKVKNGRPYFARVFVRIDPTSTNRGVTIAKDAGKNNPRTPNEWLEAAAIGARAAIASYNEHNQRSSAVIVTAVTGTEVDTSPNSVEVAAFCATWKALGGGEDKLKLKFDDYWRVDIEAE